MKNNPQTAVKSQHTWFKFKVENSNTEWYKLSAVIGQSHVPNSNLLTLHFDWLTKEV